MHFENKTSDFFLTFAPVFHLNLVRNRFRRKFYKWAMFILPLLCVLVLKIVHVTDNTLESLFNLRASIFWEIYFFRLQCGFCFRWNLSRDNPVLCSIFPNFSIFSRKFLDSQTFSSFQPFSNFPHFVRSLSFRP